MSITVTRDVLATALRNVADYGRRLRREGLVSDYEGNVSIRLPRIKRIAITPSQQAKSILTENQILVVDYPGRVVQGVGRPSTEMKTHLAIYRARRDLNAIIHTHSTYASALAASRQKLPVFLDEQAHFLRGEILCADYAPAGSIELAESAVKSLGSGAAVLLANHGVVSCGGSLEEAFRNAELVERTAKVYLLSRLTGGPILLRGGRH